MNAGEKSKRKANTVIHATLDMDSTYLAEVRNGQIAELNKLQVILDCKDDISKVAYNSVSTLSKVAASPSPVNHDSSQNYSIVDNIEGSRKFLLKAHGISALLCVVLAICTISTMVNHNCYSFWESESYWIWPLFFSLSFVIGLFIHTIGKHINIHNLLAAPILIFYVIFIYFFVNGIAGKTKSGVSMIIFIMCSSYHIVTLALALTTEFKPLHWRNFFVAFILVLPFIAACIFIDYKIWPLTFVLGVYNMVNSIWGIHESLTFIGESYRSSVNFGKNNYLQLTLAMMTNPIVLPLCYIITIVHMIRGKPLPTI